MTSFCPEIWPEELTPKSLQNCQDCGLYQHGTRMVWGEGNPDAPIMVILDNPGARENREGRSFVCGTRQTMQQAAYKVGLGVDDLYVTYILKRRPVRTYDKEWVRKVCIHHLMDQISEKKPELILCLGNVAVQSFFNDPEINVKSLRGCWYDVNGYPTTVAYHPLAIRRRPHLWPMFFRDWEFVANRLKAI